MRVTAAIEPSKQAVANVLAQCMGNGCVIRDQSYTGDQCDLELSKRSAERTFRADRGYIHAALHLPIESKDKLTAASIVVNGELFAPTIDKKSFTSAKSTLIEELNASRSDPTNMCQYRLMNAMFSTSPYDKSIEQKVEDIRNVSLEHVDVLKASLKRAVTAVTVSRVQNTSDRFDTFVSRLKKSYNVQRLQWVPKPKKSVVETFSIPGNASTVLMMGQVTSLQHDDPKIYALRAAVHALGGGMSGRLMSTIRGKMGLGTYGVYANLHYSPDYPAFLVVHGTFAPASAAAGANKIQEMLSDWARNGLTEEELSMWKTHFQGPRAMALDTPSSLVDTHHQSLLLGKDPQTVWDEFPEHVEQVTLQAVRDVLGAQIDPSRFVTVRCGDIPTAPAITADDESDAE